MSSGLYVSGSYEYDGAGYRWYPDVPNPPPVPPPPDPEPDRRENE